MDRVMQQFFNRLKLVLLSYCGILAELEDIFHCHVDSVMKNAIKDEIVYTHKRK